MSRPFTVFVLLFEDYLDLARRCLRSIRQGLPDELYELRILLNAQSPRLRSYVCGLEDCSAVDVVYPSDANRRKYPAMRQAFHDPAHPIVTPYVMWFDDDSFLREPLPPNWPYDVLQKLEQADMVGSVYKLTRPSWPTYWTDKQRQWVARQPWYTGVPTDKPPSFATGGWWVIRSELIRKYQWPPPDAYHLGGDVMLGEVCRQQQLRLASFNNGVAINADPAGDESAAERRGDKKSPRLGS